MENYIIEGLINSGSFGTVKKALDIRTNRYVAIKHLPIKRHDITPVKNSAMINREIEVWSALSKDRHPNILCLDEFHYDSENVNFVSEYCKRGTLADMQSKKNFTIGDIKYIMRDILNGLDYCHQNGIMHSDIKPANILLADDDNFKLCDFGHSQLNNNEYSGLWFRRGTPLYMAPEFYDGQEYGNNADIWAVGILMYMLIFKKHPFFDNDDILNLSKRVKVSLKDFAEKSKIINIPEKLIDIDMSAVNFLKDCLEYDKTKRMSCQDAIKHPFMS